MCLLPISSVWLGLGLGCVAGHNYNPQRSPERGKVVTERWRLVNYVVHYVCREGLFNTWGGSSCGGWGSRGSFIGRRARPLSQSARSCGILHRFGLLEVLNLLMFHSSLLATCGVPIGWSGSRKALALLRTVSRVRAPLSRIVSSSTTLRLLQLYRPACTPWMVATTGSTVHTPSGVSSRSPPLVSRARPSVC